METDARALNDLIDLVHKEGPVSPAMQAIMTYAVYAAAAFRTTGRMLDELGTKLIPVGLPAAIS